MGSGPGAPSNYFLDCAGASYPAAGLANPSAETKAIATATRALVHYAESHGVNIKFTHVHSHQGHGLNEFADNVANAGAGFLHCSGLPYQFYQDWYSLTSGVPECASLMNLTPWTKTQYGFPPVCGNVLSFSMATMPCVHSPIQEKSFVLRDIALTMASYNIGAVAEKAYTNGVTALAGKAHMLADGFRREKLCRRC